MSEFDFENCSLEELWKFVATFLESEKVGVTLVGGGVATIYSKGKYLSGDLDFVLDSLFMEHGTVEKKLLQIGFVKKGVIYRHPRCRFTLEYKSPPIEIGEDSRVVPEEVESGGVNIKILTPTDCIKDRLNKYVLYKDRDAFDAAVDVAKERDFVLEKVKKFCETNKLQKAFLEFLEALKN